MNISKLVLIIASLTITGGLAAQQVVVFAKGDSLSLDSGSQVPPSDPVQAAFLDGARRNFAQAAAFDTTFPLINPPAWGRVVSPETGGSLQIRHTYSHGFFFHIEMVHLLPAHNYVLCINGRPEHAGNELLPQSVPGHDAEKYLDFYTITTDDSGSYRAGFALLLRPGNYNVHFYVKDVSDHKIVLYGLEYFDFTAN